MRKEIYVIYWGRQDHTHFSPLKIDESIIWLSTPSEASQLVSQLNIASQHAFYGEGSTYTRLTDYADEGGALGSLDYYPIQYSWKKIKLSEEPSTSDTFSKIEGEHYRKWKNIYEQDD